MKKATIITAIAALGFASAAAAQDITATPNVMTRNVPAESVQGPNDSGSYLFDFATVSFGDRTVSEIDSIQFPRAAAASSTGLMTSYVFDGAGDTGNNDFSPR